MQRITFHKNTFIYIDHHKNHRAIYHYNFDDPLDTSRVAFPYQYERESKDNTVSGFELACCHIIDLKYNYNARMFQLGSFFKFPVSTLTESYIKEFKRQRGKDFYNMELALSALFTPTPSGSEPILKAIGVELAKEYHAQHCENKKAFKDITNLPSDVNTRVLLPYVYEEFADIDTYFPDCDEYTLQTLPVDYSIDFYYEDGEVKRVSCLLTHGALFCKYSFYNKADDHCIGIYVEPRHVVLLRREYPIKMQLVFHHVHSQAVFYKSDFVEVANAKNLMDAQQTLNEIEWPQDD